MNKFLAIAAMTAVAAAYSTAASADAISGSQAYLAQTNDSGQDLSTRATYSVTGYTGSGTGNFTSNPPSLTQFVTNALNLSDIGANNVDTSFILNVPGYYSFTSDHAFVTNQNSTALNLFITGTLTPANPGPFSTLSVDTASLNIGFTRTGNASSGFSTSASLTLASPALPTPPPTPPAVPEPASMALIGAGLLGLGLVRRRKA